MFVKQHNKNYLHRFIALNMQLKFMLNYIHMTKGCIHIYTGNGKGKTTAAIGLAIRAKGRGFRVLLAQFMKGRINSSEINVLKNSSVTIKRFHNICSPYFHPDIDRKQLRKEVIKAIAYIKTVMEKGIFNLIILDEFNCLIAENLITDNEAIDLISYKPESLELVLTGRGATKKLIDIADYATEMRMIKHPFSRGIRAKKGIEY